MLHTLSDGKCWPSLHKVCKDKIPKILFKTNTIDNDLQVIVNNNMEIKWKTKLPFCEIYSHFIPFLLKEGQVELIIFHSSG